MSVHADQAQISAGQVAALVVDQAPALAGEEITVVDGGGTDHAIFRVGDGATARFPLRSGDPELRARLEGEAAAAAEFHQACPVAAPEPLLVGEPGHGYPLPWLLQTWVDGQSVTPTSCADSLGFARDLALLIGSLRQWGARGRRFQGQGRGGDLASHDAWVGECIRRSEGLFDASAMRRLWSRFRELPRTDLDVMSHTDLIPGNLLVAAGRLAGVLDTGGFQAADPALDLVAAWHLLDDGPRERLRAELGCDDLQWERGKAWAFQQAAGAYWYYRSTNSRMAAMGRTTLERIAADG